MAQHLLRARSLNELKAERNPALKGCPRASELKYFSSGLVSFGRIWEAQLSRMSHLIMQVQHFSLTAQGPHQPSARSRTRSQLTPPPDCTTSVPLVHHSWSEEASDPVGVTRESELGQMLRHEHTLQQLDCPREQNEHKRYKFRQKAELSKFKRSAVP